MHSKSWHMQLISIVILAFLSTAFQPVFGQSKHPDAKQLKQQFKALQEQHLQKNTSKKFLNTLDIQSVQLLQQLNLCEQYNETELNRLTQARKIDALEDSSIQSKHADEKKPEPDYPGTEEIDAQIKAHTKELINCRLMSSRLD